MFYIHIIYFYTEQELKNTTPRPDTGPWTDFEGELKLFDTFDQAKEFLTKEWKLAQVKHNFKISDSWGWEPKERLFEYPGVQSYGQLNYAYGQHRAPLYWIRPNLTELKGGE